MNENRLNEIRMEILSKKQEIEILKGKLSFSYSDIGDWKIVKIYEYRMQGLADPYDMNELSQKRQAARDEINNLMNEITVLETEEKGFESNIS